VRLPAGSGVRGAASDDGSPVPPAERLHSLLPVRQDVRALLAAAALRAHDGLAAAEGAVVEAAAALPGVGWEPGSVPEDPGDEVLDGCLQRLRRLSPGLGRRLLEGFAFAVHRAGPTTREAAALVRRGADRLGIELPEAFG
jgi:hypothetical protein